MVDGLKLDSPMDLAFPSACSRSNVCQVEIYWSLPGRGLGSGGETDLQRSVLADIFGCPVVSGDDLITPAR